MNEHDRALILEGLWTIVEETKATNEGIGHLSEKLEQTNVLLEKLVSEKVLHSIERDITVEVKP